MNFLSGVGKFLWRFMVVFSFIVNLVLVVVLLGLLAFIFQIKNQVADPLIMGLHSTATGLGEATIDWTIPVRDTIPVELNIPLQTDTIVTLTEPVPLAVSATIDLPGLNATGATAFVNLTLPAGLELPVALDLDVAVDEPLDVALDVRAIIPLQQTQLSDPISTLGLLFEPLAIGLHNLPGSFAEIPDFVGQSFNSETNLQTLLLDTEGNGFNEEPYDAWPGFSLTAGENYNLYGELFPEGNVPAQTNIVPPGGIPALDALVRAELYEGERTPEIINENAIEQLNASTGMILPQTWNGAMSEYYAPIFGIYPLTAGGEPIVVPLDSSVQTAPLDDDGASGELMPDSALTATPDTGILPTPASE